MFRSFQISRLGPFLALTLLGFSIVVAVQTASPGPRLSRRQELADLISLEDGRTRALRRQLEALHRDLEQAEIAAGKGARSLERVRRRAESLRLLAGLEEVHGPGVLVELRDSTLSEAPTGDPNDLVIHEEDLQAIVNALWAAGAEAMAINGERITATSAVRCVGNTLLLHGSVYSPPYRIAAIGNVAGLRGGIETDPLVERFRIFAREFRLGFDVSEHDFLALPGFRGLVAAGRARVIG